MKIFKGISASGGIAEGSVCCYSASEEADIPHYSIKEDQVKNEVLRLGEGIDKAIETMSGIIASSQKIFDKKSSEIFNAHIMIFKDKSIKNEIVKLITEKKVNAEHAVMDAFQQYMDRFSKSGMHFEEISHDMLDVRNRLLEALGSGGGHFACPVGEREAVIVASRIFTPSMILSIPREHILAFVTQEGGYTTHATILARSYGIPVIFGIDVQENLKCKDRAIVDAFTGKVIVHPDKKTREYYFKKIEKIRSRNKVCDVEAANPARLKTGSRIELKLNINTPLEINLISGLNHSGIGLLRTEFLFLKRDSAPSEDEQVEMYRQILAAVPNKPVTVRMLDIDSEKVPPYFTLPPQINPDLGIRGARAAELFPDIYLTQAKALLRAGIYGDLRVLYPMVSDLSDAKTFSNIFDKAVSILIKEKKEFKRELKKGIMIETPAAALMAGDLLKKFDFANIGSNDLLQYTLAAERGNAFVEKRYHILHPAIVKLIEYVVKAGDSAGKEVCLCGEIAAFEEFYPLLLDIGLRSFSISVTSFNAMKCGLLHIESHENGDILDKFYRIGSKEKLDIFFSKHYE